MNKKELEGKLETLEREFAQFKAAAAKPRFPARLFSRANILLGALLAALAVGSALYAVTVPNSFSDGTVISAGEINANFTALAEQITTNETNIGALTGQVTANEAAENGTEVVYLKDVKAPNANGGTATAGGWVTRVLNTIENPLNRTWITGPSANQFTLAAGTYEVFVTCPAFFVARSKCKLRNTVDSSDTILGTSEYTDRTGSVANVSIIQGQFTIAGTKTFEIQHQVELTNANSGFGVSSNFGVAEVYTVVKIKRLSD